MGMYGYEHTYAAYFCKKSVDPWFLLSDICSWGPEAGAGGVLEPGICWKPASGPPPAMQWGHCPQQPDSLLCEEVFQGAFRDLKALIINPALHMRSIDLCTQSWSLTGIACTKQTVSPLWEPGRVSKQLSPPVCSISRNTGVRGS